MADIAKLEGKLDSENAARKSEIAALDGWAKGENDARKTEIENLNNFARSENDARKAEIADLDKYAKSENEGRIQDIADINARLKKENEDRTGAYSPISDRLPDRRGYFERGASLISIFSPSWPCSLPAMNVNGYCPVRGCKQYTLNFFSAEDQALSDRLDKERSDRDQAISDLESRMNQNNDDRVAEIDDLRTKLMRENQFLKNLASKSNSVYFDAYRNKAYDGGGEENLTFQGCYCNAGGGMDAESGVFTAPCGGTYIFVFHIATHDNKKALLSIRRNGEEVASVFDQNHKDNHKNSMAGTTVILDVQRGDEESVCFLK